MYNDNPINEIIELDKTARNIVKEAKETATTEKSKISQNRQVLQKDYSERSQKHIDKLKETHKQNAEEELNNAKAIFQEKIEILNQRYEENHIAWEKDIFEKCLL